MENAHVLHLYTPQVVFQVRRKEDGVTCVRVIPGRGDTC